MQKIVPFIWFDTQASEAAELYISAFKNINIPGNTGIKSKQYLENTPSGRVETFVIELGGFEMQLMSAGPYLTINPSISFLIICKTDSEVEELWQHLSSGGRVLMELGSYPFSDKYGWVQDKFGLTWQIILLDNQDVDHEIIPTIMFIGDNCGKTEEAIHFYKSIFRQSSIGEISRYGEGKLPDKPENIEHVDFTLEGQKFAAMDSAFDHQFKLNEAVSFIIYCQDQAEIDYYWDKLSAQPEAEQCGWLKDKFGVSWQVVPREMDTMLSAGTPTQRERVTQAFLKMKKFDLNSLRTAFNGVD